MSLTVTDSGEFQYTDTLWILKSLEDVDGGHRVCFTVSKHSLFLQLLQFMLYAIDRDFSINLLQFMTTACSCGTGCSNGQKVVGGSGLGNTQASTAA